MPGESTVHSFPNIRLGRSQVRTTVSVIPGQMGESPEETRGHPLVQVGGREPAPEAGRSKGPPRGGGISCGPRGTLKAETGTGVKKPLQETESPVYPVLLVFLVQQSSPAFEHRLWELM